jgi:hypothetical protein
MNQIKILEDAINVIENWKWNMYTDEDEVGIAVESIKELIEELKNQNI